MIVWFGLILPILLLRAPNLVLRSPSIVPLENVSASSLGALLKEVLAWNMKAHSSMC